ncbi:hypothetical protein [Streptacidiphilus rugosus]|uniref:hypothetical protein n=1 Tax=Streptacidiphilus rugosus TaxID=405783 RepID=UPI000AA035D1|nr:hypothetical protein [Streptacidiphilus rugosus]
MGVGVQGQVAAGGPEQVWGRGVVGWFLARPRVTWVARWAAAEVSVGPLFTVAVAGLGLLLGRTGATAVAVGTAMGVGRLWFRDGIAARQARQATGLGGRTVRVVAALLAGTGCLLRLVPPVAVGGFAMMCLSWLVTGVALGAVSALALPGRRARVTATAAVLALALVWLPSNRLTLGAADAAVLRSFGDPPRPLMVLVDWPGLQPDGIHYSAGTLNVTYDDGSAISASPAALQVRAAGPQSLCALLLEARAADPELTYTQCRERGGGAWASSGDGTGCALARQRDGLLLLLTDDLCRPDDTGGLESVLRTAHAVGDTALLSLPH